MHSGEGNVIKEVESGVMGSPAKEREQSPEAGKGKEQILP